MDLGNAVGIGGGFCLGIERCQFFIGGEHGFDQAFGAIGGFLAGDADPPARRHGDSAGIWLRHPGHYAKQRRLAGAVAADEADPVARIDGDAGAVEQRARTDAIGDLIKTKHGTACNTPRHALKPPCLGRGQSNECPLWVKSRPFSIAVKVSALLPKVDLFQYWRLCLLMTLSGRRPHGVAFASLFLFHVWDVFGLCTPFPPHIPIGGLYTADDVF